METSRKINFSEDCSIESGKKFKSDEKATMGDSDKIHGQEGEHTPALIIEQCTPNSMNNDYNTKSILAAIQRVEHKLDTRIAALEEKITQAVKTAIMTEVNAFKTEFNIELDNLKTRLTALETTPIATAPATNDSVDSIVCNIVLRNVPESNNENIVNKVKGVLTDGCKVRDVKVVKADRKKGHDNKPSVIVATLEDTQQRDRVMKNKRNLSASRNHKYVSISRDIDFTTRMQQNNMITLLKAMNKDNDFTFRGQHLVKKTQQQQQQHQQQQHNRRDRRGNQQ